VSFESRSIDDDNVLNEVMGIVNVQHSAVVESPQVMPIARLCGEGDAGKSFG